MSIEEKAKAYDEALEKARMYRDNAKAVDEYSAVARYENIFPELRESEDERIRKALVAYLKSDFISPFTFCGVTSGMMLDYLEKQKEQPISAEEVLARAGLKPYKDGNQWCILAGDNIQEGISGFGDTIEDALYEFLKEVLDLQKEQKPAWGEEDEKKIHFLSRLIEFQVKDGEYCFGEGACAISKQEAIEMLQSLRPQQKQEWSEEDEAMLDSVIRIITQIDDLAHEPTFAGPKWTHPYTKEIAWLKSLRPQPKQEWSDEDEKIFNNIIEKAKGGHWIEVNEITWLINRFKSLRPSWKPSEDQMTALRDVITMKRAVNEFAETKLRELYDQLMTQKKTISYV